MTRELKYGLIDQLLGRVPKSYTLTCKDCGFQEVVLLSPGGVSDADLSSEEGVRACAKLPAFCPRCGSFKLDKSDGPRLLHDII